MKFICITRYFPPVLCVSLIMIYLFIIIIIISLIILLYVTFKNYYTIIDMLI